MRIQKPAAEYARWLRGALAGRRLLIVFGAGLLLTMIEMVNHYEPGSATLFEPEFWYSAPFFALILPLTTWALLEWADRRESNFARTIREPNCLASLRAALMDAGSWDDLVEIIIEYPRQVVPATRVALFTLNEAAGGFELAGSQFSTEEDECACPGAMPPANCSDCLAALSPAEHPIRPYPASIVGVGNKAYARYCLPIISRGRLTAMLQFEFAPGRKLSDYEMETLSQAIPDITLALTNATLEHSLTDQVEATSEALSKERQHIAQNLHDSLAQNLGYLRLKLDQLSLDEKVRELTELRKDIECMRDAAAEAYGQIRGTLTNLYPADENSLTQSLRERALYIGNRGGFSVVLECRPDKSPLASEVRQQLMLICQEALINVEKHAKAREVTIQVDWGQEDLTVSIADDGVGFDPGVLSDKALGLAIMNQRAHSIGGRVTLSSTVGSGTLVTLWLPVKAA